MQIVSWEKSTSGRGLTKELSINVSTQFLVSVITSVVKWLPEDENLYAGLCELLESFPTPGTSKSHNKELIGWFQLLSILLESWKGVLSPKQTVSVPYLATGKGYTNNWRLESSSHPLLSIILRDTVSESLLVKTKFGFRKELESKDPSNHFQ